jgi:hypothetical protein
MCEISGFLDKVFDRNLYAELDAAVDPMALAPA